MTSRQTRDAESPSYSIEGSRMTRTGRLSPRQGLVAAVLLVGALAGPAAAAELVTNGGFEHPAGLSSGWNHDVSSSLSVKDFAPSAHTGDHWLSFSSIYKLAPDFIYQTLDTVVGESYDYSF